MQQLEDLQEHVQTLIKEMSENNEYGEEEFAVDVGHLYAHLNRIWNSRGRVEEPTEEEWLEDTKFPKDITPVG